MNAIDMGRFQNKAFQTIAGTIDGFKFASANVTKNTAVQCHQTLDGYGATRLHLNG
jgi:hypothetical protein